MLLDSSGIDLLTAKYCFPKICFSLFKAEFTVKRLFSLLSTRFLGPIPDFFLFSRSWLRFEICISNSFPDDDAATG